MTAWIVARRELRERWMLFAASAVAAVMPFVIAAVPVSGAGHSGEVVAAAGGILAVAFAFGIAVAMGFSVLGRELTENRLSFYFARPVSPAAIWFGKAMAAVVAIVASFAIIAIPTYLASSQYWREYWSITSPKMAALMVGGAVLLFLVVHAASTMVRSRSALFALDFVLFVVALLVAAMIVRPLMDVFAAKLAVNVIIGIAVGIAIALAVAPVYQLAFGRTDRRRSHRALTTVLWPAIAVVLVLAAGSVAWVFAAKPGDLKNRHVVQSPAGSYLAVAGEARGRADYKPVFLVDTTDGSVYRTPAPPFAQVAFSRDGSAAAWLEIHDFNREVLAAVRRDGAVRRVHVRGFGQLALSDDGSRLMSANNRSIEVYDVASDKLLAVGQTGDVLQATNHAMFFVAPNVVRWVAWENRFRSLRIHDLDVAKKHLTPMGEVTLPATTVLTVNAAPDGSRLLVSWGNGWGRNNEYRVLDARTAAIQQSFTAMNARFLGDGTIATLTRDASGRLMAGNVALPMQNAAIAGEVAPGVIAVSGGLRVCLVDLRRGALVRTFDHLQAVWGGQVDGDVRAVPLSGPRPLVLQDGYGKVSRVDPVTGGRTQIL